MKVWKVMEGKMTSPELLRANSTVCESRRTCKHQSIQKNLINWRRNLLIKKKSSQLKLEKLFRNLRRLLSLKIKVKSSSKHLFQLKRICTSTFISNEHYSELWPYSINSLLKVTLMHSEPKKTLISQSKSIWLYGFKKINQVCLNRWAQIRKLWSISNF